MSEQGSTPQGEDLGALAARLRELASQLRSPELADEEAERLAREAADLVAQAGNEIDRALRDASAGG
ncbi:hypothetical protein BH10ACT11_BH10ACT11_02580 [soil metagenome]